MPGPLRNPRHEKFAQAYLIEPLANRAAIKAGFSVRSANAHAHKLAKRPDVRARITELQTEAQKRNEMGLDRIIHDLEEIYKLGIAAPDGRGLSPAQNAKFSQAKILGLVTDKVRVEDQSDASLLQRIRGANPQLADSLERMLGAANSPPEDTSGEDGGGRKLH